MCVTKCTKQRYHKSRKLCTYQCYRAFFFLVFSSLLRYVTVQHLNLQNTLYRPFLGFLELLFLFFVEK